MDSGEILLGREMTLTDGSMSVYEFAGSLVRKAGRMMLRAAYVRDDNPYVDKEVKGSTLKLWIDGRGTGE